jgi:hypothetical protein
MKGRTLHRSYALARNARRMGQPQWKIAQGAGQSDEKRVPPASLRSRVGMTKLGSGSVQTDPLPKTYIRTIYAKLAPLLQSLHHIGLGQHLDITVNVGAAVGRGQRSESMSSPMSKMERMLGWLSAAAARASWAKRCRRSRSAENDAGSTLMATVRSRRESCAR